MRRIVWSITLAIFVIAFGDAVFSSDNSGDGLFWALALILLVGLIDIVARGIAARPSPHRWRVVALAVGAVVLLAAAPWIAPIFPGVLGDLIVWAIVIPALVALFLMARSLSPGLAIGASILTILVLVWATGWSALLAYKAAWLGLDIRDVSGIDQGDGFGIGLAVISLTVLSPVLGFGVGVLSQVGKARGTTTTV